jgi:hypothetical protein
MVNHIMTLLIKILYYQIEFSIQSLKTSIQQKGALSGFNRQRALYQIVKPGFDLLTRKLIFNQPLFPTSSLY